MHPRSKPNKKIFIDGNVQQRKSHCKNFIFFFRFSSAHYKSIRIIKKSAELSVEH